jgi:hypothetical protein
VAQEPRRVSGTRLAGSEKNKKLVSEIKSATSPDSKDVFLVLWRAKVGEKFKSKLLLCCRKAACANYFANSNNEYEFFAHCEVL